MRRFFGQTDAAGTWTGNALVKGRYRVEIWHPRLRGDPADLARVVTVGDTERSELTVRLPKPLRPAPLQGRPHSWDAY